MDKEIEKYYTRLLMKISESKSNGVKDKEIMLRFIQYFKTQVKEVMTEIKLDK